MAIKTVQIPFHFRPEVLRYLRLVFTHLSLGSLGDPSGGDVPAYAHRKRL